MSELKSNHGLRWTPLETVPDRVRATLATSRINLVRGYPLLGYLVMTTEYRFSDDLETMGATHIPQNTIYINPDFMMNVLKSHKEISFVLAHEVMHIHLIHADMARKGTYHPGLWNVATDYMVNGFLCSMGTRFMEMPEMGLYREDLLNKSADEIYHILLEEHDGDANAASNANGGYMVMDDPNNSDNTGEGTGKRPFDHIIPESLPEHVINENKQRLSAAVDIQNRSNDPQQGTGMADLIKHIGHLIAPVIPWPQLLAEFVDNTAKQYYTYNKASRRSGGSIIFPTMTGNHLNLVFGADTSGSMGQEDLESAISELKSIVDNFDGFDLTFLTCDTAAHVIGEYSSEDGDDWYSISKNMVGGGGTSLEPMVEYANNMEDQPAVIVIITDGYFDPTSLDNEIADIPVFVIVTRKGNQDFQMENGMVVFM